MGFPDWWDERRFGLMVHTNVAAVPAWAPIGARVDCYRDFLGETDPGDGPGSDVLVEVLAHHRDRWGHIERFDDFVPLLRFADFDAEAWARLAVDAGARYAATTALDRDGWVWWDAPTTSRTMVTNGPQRNVVADFASACERNDLPIGVFYALPGGDDRHDRSTLAMHDLVDLIDRRGIEFVRLDGAVADGRPSDDLLAEIIAVAPNVGLEADPLGTRLDDMVVQTFASTPPDDILSRPWELRRDLGRAVGHNRAEREEHLCTAHDVVALLTEVVAKGGHLLLGVGVDADGVIPDLQAAPLRAAGDWIRRHDHLVNAGQPWTRWGNLDSRLIELDGAISAVDVGGRGHFADLDTSSCRVDAVEIDGAAVPFRQDEDGLHIDLHRFTIGHRQHRGPVDIVVYRVTVSEPERPMGLFETEPREPVELAPLLRAVAPGDIVQLGDGVYVGPVSVPAGVTVRGLGGRRTVIDPAGVAVTVGAQARLEHLRVRDTDGVNEPAVQIVGDSALVLGCRVDGTIAVDGDDAALRATSARGARTAGAERLTVARCQFTGPGGDGIQVAGGSGHRISSCEIDGHRNAIHLVETVGTVITGNNLSAQRSGVHLERCEGVEVQGNFVNHSMRGITIDGGANATVRGNAVCDGDSGCIVQWGAAGCEITGNTWERCRIGVLAWGAGDVAIRANEAIDLHEPDAAFTVGP